MHDHPYEPAVRSVMELVTAPPRAARWRTASAAAPPQAGGRFRLGRPLGALAVMATTAAVLVTGLVVHWKAIPSTGSASAPPPSFAPVIIPFTGVPATPSAATPAATAAGTASPVATTPPAPPEPVPTARPTTPPSPSTSPTATASAVPAFPYPPTVTADGHGGVYISGSGEDYWHIAYSMTAKGAVVEYSGVYWQDPPSSITDYTVPAQYNCVSIQPEKGGTGWYNDGQLGSGGPDQGWSRPVVCVR